jgi:hypothetical protein
MRNSWSLFAVLLFSSLAFSGCQIVGDIFKAGVWVGVLLVVGVIALIVWLFTRSTS